MKVPKFLIIGTGLFLFICAASAQKSVPDGYCLTDDEHRLAGLINAHRQAGGLKEIPLSASLCHVARTHVIDLYTNHPDTGICSLNSWSDKGSWTACCHNRYIPKEVCIRNKPSELTNYTGEGYELAYSEVFDAVPDTVFRFWKKIDEANDFLLNKKAWEKKSWRAMGVGMYKNYAVIWMGQRSDPLPAPVRCSKDAAGDVQPAGTPGGPGGIPVISGKTGRYYVIIGSFQSEADARREAGKYQKLDGARLSILRNNQGQYRVSINDYPGLDAAKQGKNNYGSTFPGSWILNF
jgi:hypothetical protein